MTQNLLIFGNVEEGALVVSDKSVLVMGTLRGEIFCGADTQMEEHAFVLALDFAPSRVKIGPYRVSDKEMKGKRGWGRKWKGPVIAFVDKTQEKIQVEPVQSNLFTE